jgi:putative serine protease PepD
VPRRSVLVVVAVGLALVGGVVGGAIVRGTQGSSSGAGSCRSTTVADTVLPSVVTINVQIGATGGNGSGEIIRPGGYILTNNHVISPAVGGGQVSVVLTSGQCSRPPWPA